MTNFPTILPARTVFLRLVEINDAAFICGLRNKKKLNLFLSKSENSMESQLEWLEQYKYREAQNQEFYFIISRKDNNQPIGTIRIYDFQKPSSFCWGSWILNENKTASSALESALLIYNIGFDYLNFEQSHFDVRKNNVKVNSFHIKMGAVKTREDNLNIYYKLSKESHLKNKEKYRNFLLGDSK